MAAGDFIKGKNLRLKIEGKVAFHATECSWSTSMEFEDIATKDTMGKVSIPGDFEFSASTSMLLAEKAVGGTQHDVYDLLDLYKTQEVVEIEFTKIIKANYYIQQCDISANTGSAATGNFSFKGTGDFTIETVA
jgi:hypothetical protein